MVIKWAVFCMEHSLTLVKDKLAPVVEQTDPTIMERLRVQHRYWRDPELYRIGCAYVADQMPENLKEHVARIGGSDQIYTIEKENYLQFSCEATHEEMKRDPNRTYAVCAIYIEENEL